MRASQRYDRQIVAWAIVAIVALVATMWRGCGPARSHNSVEKLPPMEVYFSPHGGCTEAVVAEIDRAERSVLVQAYSFTSAPIAKALVDAHQRGVEVSVILDKSQESERYSSADFVLHAGISTFIDEHHAIAHNKIMILDGHTVVTGSFNFTKAAEESNAENLLVIRDAGIADLYTQNWRQHAEHSVAYTGRKTPEESTPASPHSSPKGTPSKKGKSTHRQAA